MSALRRLMRSGPVAAARLRAFLRLPEDITEAKMMTARLLIGEMKRNRDVSSFAEVEFKVFSQFGDDGIIQYLIHRIGIPRELRTFVEFGVEDYGESNTRFLLMNDNWRGLIMDGSRTYMRRVKHSRYYWKHDLRTVAAFVTRDNIDELIGSNGFRGEIGLLSIDIDGNDFWVWQRLSVVRPWIVVAEYNSLFGAEHAVSIPYDYQFTRARAHYSNVYWGCSLKALDLVARKKGYAFVGCNSAGNNAYFVLEEKLGALQPIRPEEGYVAARFRESRDRSGRLTFASREEALRGLAELDIWDVAHDRSLKIREVFCV
jgi:hypothetical protein